MKTVTTAGILAACFCIMTRSGSAIERPNIIFLMDDQHRWDALGVVNPDVRTPNLDRLADNGILFDQAVCQAPMCVPSRNSLMLGLYPNQIGVLRNGPGIKDHQLPSLPLAEVLRKAGYQTAGFGKTHWGVTSSTRGFETRYSVGDREVGAITMGNENPEGMRRYSQEISEYGAGEENTAGYIGRTSQVAEKDHWDGWVSEKCLDFIESDLDGRPLFLYLSFIKPHAGHNVPEGYEKLYDIKQVEYAEQPPWREDDSPHAGGVNRRKMYEEYWSKASEQEWKLMTMRYWANCTWIDDMFGRVLEALKRKGVLKNSLIVYVSDHGEMLGERYYRFNKYNLYESSVRVPIILSGNVIPEKLRGSTVHRPVELVDIYPTLLSAAEVPSPAVLPGLDLLDRQTRSGSFSALHERPEEAAFMWRTRHHKLILRMKRKADASKYTASDIIGGEFYDLQADGKEWNNLYDQPEAQPNVRKSMTKELLKHLSGLAPLPPITGGS